MSELKKAGNLEEVAKLVGGLKNEMPKMKRMKRINERLKNQENYKKQNEELINKWIEDKGKISTIKLIDMINEVRKEDGRSEYGHQTLMSKVRVEYERQRRFGNSKKYAYDEVPYLNKVGVEKPSYMLDKNWLSYLRNVITNNDRSVYQKAYEMLGGEKFEIICNTRFEDTFINKLTKTLSSMGIEISRSHPFEGYRVDAYLPEYNLIVEYDEEFHESKLNIVEDLERENKILDEHDVEFVRVCVRETDEFNIGKVMRKLFID